ncbi:hypothetical protein [Polyangium jinanense]|uniref:Uncharacterized protein n=1 Tax=Polyangium jinanense TaxID=2829994 RepID=A0A9X3X0A5_9BACT|nr:hypothetical protein [Polyangium jinanense]MDC3953858.1 hypothetical protein [Polyangium jinanense]MDC3979021.1 hypothetical protein [Polyangium jinanense]
MSGVKSLRIRSSQRDEEALRRAAAERAKQAREEASKVEASKPLPPVHVPRTAPVEACLRRVERSIGLLSACVALGVALDREAEQARGGLVEFTRQPDAARIGAVDALVARVSPRTLEEVIAARQEALSRALAVLEAPAWQRQLEAFRPGLAADLRGLAGRRMQDGLANVASLLGELDALLAARARARVVSLCEGGVAAGLRASEVRFEAREGAFVAELSDDHGVFARIAEHLVSWAALPEIDAIEMRGPAEWDGPACVHGGYADVLGALRAQGVEAELYGEDGRALWPAGGDGAGGAVVVLQNGATTGRQGSS